MAQNKRPLSSRMKMWTLATTLTWLKVRSAMEVDRVTPDGRVDVGKGEDWRSVYVEKWENELRPELFAGTITATASMWKGNTKHGDQQIIDPKYWREATLRYGSGDRWVSLSVDIPADRDERGDLAFVLKEITFERADVQRVFASERQQSRTLEEISSAHSVSLFDVKEWIICRGEAIPYELYEEREAGEEANSGVAEVVGAEREMFNKIDAATKEKRLDVYGIKEDDRRRQQVVLPTLIWATMNKAPGYPPSFTEITFDDCPVPGVNRSRRALLYGTIHLADETYNFVNVPSSFVLETWPPNVAEPSPKEEKVPRPKNSNEADEMRGKAVDHFNEITEHGKFRPQNKAVFVEDCKKLLVPPDIAGGVYTDMFRTYGWKPGRPKDADRKK